MECYNKMSLESEASYEFSKNSNKIIIKLPQIEIDKLYAKYCKNTGKKYTEDQLVQLWLTENLCGN